MKKQKPKSQMPAIVGMVLTVGCATAFSLLAAFDVISLHAEGKKVRERTTRPPPRFGPEEREVVNTPDTPLDPAEETRLAGELNERFRLTADREKDIVKSLREHANPDPNADLAVAMMRRVSEDNVRQFVWSPDGAILLGSGFRNTYVWDVRTGQLQHSFPVQLPVQGTHPIPGTAITPDGKTLAFLSSPTHISLSDLQTKAVRPLADFNEQVISLALSPDGKSLAVAHKSGDAFLGHLKLFDLTTGKVRKEAPWQGGPAEALHYTPDGRTIVAVAGFGGEARMLDAQTGRNKRVIKDERFLALSRDGKTLVTHHEKEGIRLRDVATSQVKKSISTGKIRFWKGALSPDAKWLATEGELANKKLSGFAIKLWDLEAGVEKLQFTQSEYMNQMAFSPGGSCWEWIVPPTDIGCGPFRIYWMLHIRLWMPCANLPR